MVDNAEDGGEELFTKTDCILNQIPIEFLMILNSNAIYHGKNFLAAIFSVIIY